jgi:hypothetical protein
MKSPKRHSDYLLVILLAGLLSPALTFLFGSRSVSAVTELFRAFHKTLITFTSDGSEVGTAWAPALNSLSGSGHGEWVRTGNREFAITGLGLWFNAGSLLWRGRIRATIKLNPALDRGHGPIHLDVLDAEGNVLRSLHGRVQGTRMRVEPLE